MPPSLAQSIDVDYTKDPSDVLKDLILTSLTDTQRLIFLPYLTLSRNDDGPSWIPDWKRGRKTPGYVNRSFCASGESASRATYNPPETLEVIGVPVADVATVEQLRLQEPAEMIEMLQNMGLQELEKQYQPTGEPLLDAHVHTLTDAILGDYSISLSLKTLRPMLSDWREEIIGHSNSAGSKPEKLRSSNYAWDIHTYANNSYVFHTTEGLLGKSPCEVKPGKLNPTLEQTPILFLCPKVTHEPPSGDRVSIILGCEVPMILSPRGDGKYQVVGGCYLHGYMNGEAVLGRLSWDWKVLRKKELCGVIPVYSNSKTGQITMRDPRLLDIPLPPQWKSVKFERTRDDPKYCSRKFRNRGTGEIISSDPRLFPEALEARGITLQTFALV